MDVLGQLLVSAGIVTKERMNAVVQTRSGADTLDQILIAQKVVTSTTLLALLSEHFGVPFVSLPSKVEATILRLVPEQVIESAQAIPVSLSGRVLTVAMTDPSNRTTLDRLSALSGYEIKPVGILPGDYRQFFSRYYEDGTMAQILKEIEMHSAELELPDQANADDERGRPIIKFVDTMLTLAIRKRASDVHIEPQDEYALIRFRVDGLLQTQQIVPKSVVNAVVARIKVLCSMDITDRRRPQDGQFRQKVADGEVDVRVATIPSRYGEKVALRVLDRRSFLMELGLLGLPEEHQKKILSVVSRPNGLLLVTGPTGSGKTTTMYGILQQMRSSRTNIMTLEDPIEYELLAGSKREGGITQIQINPKVGLTFATGLRSCLRQDPDVIFVGEIRDRETAETAISASLTGHLVLSTLHTNGAIQTITRMLDMGIEPFLIVSSLRLVVAQRLLRVLCTNCREAYDPPADALARLGLKTESSATFYRAVGCEECLHQGYLGRTGVFEMLMLTNDINRLILEKRPPGEIFQKASQESQFRTLKQQGMDLVQSGQSTIEEVLRVLPQM